ncbi:MAG: VanZ family protein [Candidatus Zixiibacteriota bacterium]
MVKFDKKLFYYKLPPVLLAALIILLSSLPNAHPPSFNIRNIDKFYHGLEYFLFGLLLFRAFPDLHGSPRKAIYYALLFGFGFAYAGLDETVQSFVPNRDSSIGDWLADATGYTVAGVVTIWYRLKRRTQEPDLTSLR